MPSIYGTIILAATHSRITIVKREQITCDSVNSLKIKFEFRTTDWEEMTKNAVFWNARDYSNQNDDTQISVILDENGECFIPHEIINQCGKFMVGVFGVNGTKRLPTNFVALEIEQGCYGTCSESYAPTPSEYAQLTTLINTKATPAYILGSITGYDATKVQILQNVNGTFRWINSE